jgi:hypothetical protein
MTEIRVGGATLRLPDNAPPEAVQAAITHFRSTPEFDKLVDKRRGAPARVRMMVGSAPIGDRLANLQRFYPDAVPYGDDNFVFSDPETGRPTLYNPPGLDLGDVPAVGREISQFVGGGFGAVVGAPFGGPMGSAVGAGAGAAAGGAAFDAVMNLQGRVDTRGPLGTVLDAAVDFGANAVGQRVGEMLGAGIKRALGGGRVTAQRLVEQFQRLGIDPPPAGAASGSRAVGGLEQALRANPASASVMQEQAEQVLAQVKRSADDLAARFGPARSVEGAGQTIRQAARAAAERVGLRQEAIYDEAFDLIGEATPVPLEAVTSLAASLQREAARAPQSLQRALGPAIRQLDQLLEDAGEQGLEFGALRQVRTIIGRELGEPVLNPGGSNSKEALKRIYGALTEDMSRAAREAGPDAAQRLAVADRYTRQWARTAAQTMAKIDKFDADEKAFRFAMTASRDGGTALGRMRRHFQPEEWDVVAGTVLQRMGLARAGAQDATGEAFSIQTFLTNWNQLAPEAKQALFGGARYRELTPQLDALVDAVGSLKGMERLANTSNTANVVAAHAALSTSMAALGFVATGDVSGAAGAVGLGLIGPRMAAKLITSPRFVSWLTTPVTSPGALSAHIGRLAAIAEAEPLIREEIHQFAEALRQAPEPAGSAAGSARESAGSAGGSPPPLDNPEDG